MTEETQKITKTESMFMNPCPYNNPYQGKDRRVLFVCSAGILRSATGARIYANKYNTRAAGSEHYALIPVTDNLLLWADEIVFVNPENMRKVSQQFDLDSYFTKDQIKCLNIPDVFDHMHPKLIEYFEMQYEPVNKE